MGFWAISTLEKCFFTLWERGYQYIGEVLFYALRTWRSVHWRSACLRFENGILNAKSKMAPVGG